MRYTILPALCLVAGLAEAGVRIDVTVDGTVSFNGISAPPLGNAGSGDPVQLRFQLDSDDFLNSPNFPTRGYRIVPDTFGLQMGGQVGLQNPFPPGAPAFFVLRDNDPAVDGFFVARSTDFPIGVPLNQTGNFGPFENNFSVGYGGNTLNSLDILDALGTYDFTGLNVFGWTIDDGPFNAAGIDFVQMTIECAEVPPVTYCTSKVNSLGCSPFMTTDPGSPSLSGGPWNVQANMLINNKPGLVFYGLGPNAAPFFGGTLCVLPPLLRTGVQASGGNPPPNDCSGQISLDLSSTVNPMFVPGVIYLQTWARDPGDALGISLTDAVQVQVCP